MLKSVKASNLVPGSVKVVPVPKHHTMKAYKGHRGKAPHGKCIKMTGQLRSPSKQPPGHIGKISVPLARGEKLTSQLHLTLLPEQAQPTACLRFSVTKIHLS